MQSENGILLLFYIFLNHGNERKKIEREKKGITPYYLNNQQISFEECIRTFL
jgi:hypothetical protein